MKTGGYAGDILKLCAPIECAFNDGQKSTQYTEGIVVD